MGGQIFRKMFLTEDYFTIALQKKSDARNDIPTKFKSDYVFPASRDKWAADPILVEDDNHTYLFYEAVINGKGRIEVVEVYDDCTVSSPVVILESENHYSYPFVFKSADQWYMIPESSAEDKVQLYKSIEFPFEWEEERVLLKSCLVDSTVFDFDNTQYILTFVPDQITQRVQPKCYRIQFGDTHTEIIPIEWENYDTLRVRGAGPAFSCNGKVMRPFQVSREYAYGDAVGFAEMYMDNEQYHERTIGELRADQLYIPQRKWVDGLHTFSQTSKFQVIDIRCREFCFYKMFLVLRNRLNRRRKK